MKDISQQLVADMDKQEEEFFNRSYEILDDVISYLKESDPGGELLKLHRSHRKEIIEFLTSNRASSKLIQLFYFRVLTRCKNDDDLKDPNFLISFSFLMCDLRGVYIDAIKISDNKKIENIVFGIQQKLMLRYMESVTNQIQELTESLLYIKEYLNSLSLSKQTIYLIEFPVGNSIPVKIISKFLLEEGHSLKVVRISLSRNDSKKSGITRSEILQDKFNKISINDNDLILYIDEWFTGSNFHTMCKNIKKEIINLGKSIYFLPCALLGPKANQHENYEKLCEKHDDFLSDFGKEGAEFRFQFSIMNLVKDFPNKDWFFWSEYDRLAGYRKMQITGAIISSFDSVIHEMNNNPDKLKYGKKLFLQMISDEEEIDSADYNEDDNNSVLWKKGYNDYLMCQDKFSEIDEPDISDESTPIESGMEYVIKKFEDIVSKRPAAICVNFATAVLYNSVSMDPKDRYYYQTKAPIIVKLEGHHLTLHSLFIEEFFRKI